MIRIPGKSGSRRTGGRPGLIGPLLLSIALGALAGVGSYTLQYAKGLSYLSTDPRACVNCHIMQSQYDSWQKASHHTTAVCVDCHLPHDFIGKYVAKTENGWRHGKLFTTGGFIEPIEVNSVGLKILEDNCIHCHALLIGDMRAHSSANRVSLNEDALSCLHCHATVGHGPRAGLGGPLNSAEAALPDQFLSDSVNAVKPQEQQPSTLSTTPLPRTPP